MQKALFTAGLLALTGLSGCGVWDRIVEPPKPAPTPSVATCPCAPALRGVEAAPVEAPRAARRESHHAGRHYAAYTAHGYRWQRRYAESSVDIYDYSSASSHYGAHHYGYREDVPHGVRGGEEGGQFGGSTRVWADGYGRRHIYDQSAVAHYSYQAQTRDEQRATRQDPWHGYNDDWDD